MTNGYERYDSYRDFESLDKFIIKLLNENVRDMARDYVYEKLIVVVFSMRNPMKNLL